jgi:aerobic-type carbon monoxide dehydrogenase small subunit (CoxS/CutS family)
MSSEVPVSALVLNVNGADRQIDAPPDETLLSVLRNHLQLTGTKYGCGEGLCGACTVLIDGNPTRSCRTPVFQATGRKIVTIEGLEENGQLHPVQTAFLDHEAFQCGYCTSGMIMATVALLKMDPNPTYTDIVTHMNGNVCRCGTYARITAAVKQAAQQVAQQSKRSSDGGR